jgi:hypothetical protein
MLMDVARIPQIGIGLQYSFSFAEWFPFSEQSVDSFEIIVDNLMGPLDGPYVVLPEVMDSIAPLREKVPFTAHSNFGGEMGFGPVEETAAVRRHGPAARLLGSPWISNHLFYAEDSWSWNWSCPLQFSHAELARLAPRMRRLQELNGIPLLHENPAYYFPAAGSEMSDAEFLAHLVESADTYIHLDLHNIYANTLNLPAYRWQDYLAEIPMERVLALHLAGGRSFGGFYHDSHDSASPDEVWEMLEQVLGRARVRSVILEFVQHGEGEQGYLSNEQVLELVTADLKRAAEIWDRAYGRGIRSSSREGSSSVIA